MEEFDDTFDVGDIDDLIDELEGGGGEFGFGGSGGSGINFTGGMLGEIPSFEPMDPFESFFGSPNKPFQTPSSVDPFEFPPNNPATSGPGGMFSPSIFEPSTSSGPSLTSPVSNPGYTVGTPSQTAASMLAQALAAEQTRHNRAQEALAAQELALKNQLAQAQMRAAAGDPTAASQASQIQGQLEGLAAQKLAAEEAHNAALVALEQQKLAQQNSQFMTSNQTELQKLLADQKYREGLLAAEASKLGLSREELQANILLSREKLNAQIDQFNKTYGLDWMKNAQSVEQFNQQLGFDYWQSGNQLLFNTWQTQMEQQTAERGQNLSYNLGAGRLNLDTQGQMFDQTMQLSNLAANPRNLAQSLIMMGLSPSAAREFMASTPLVSTWMNHSTDLDRMPYQSAVPFEYGDNDLPLSFLPAGNDMRGYGFMPPGMSMPMMPTGPSGSLPPPNFNMTPPPMMNVPSMTPPSMSLPVTPPPLTPEPTPTTPLERGTPSNTAPPMQVDEPQAAPITVPSFADWAKTSGYSYTGGYPSRSPTGRSVIPNRGLDPYYGSSTRKQGR